MAVTVKDLLNLEIMKDFKIVAGKEGLSRKIDGIEILDFEFVQEGEAYRKRGFIGNSLVLSSLLFAKDEPELVMTAIKKLIEQNVQGLAYKPVFFETLPKQALDYAEERNFPILEFGHDEFFEDIIFGVKDLIEKDGTLGMAEPLFGEMLKREFSLEEANEAHEKIQPLLRPLISVICLKAEDTDEEKTASIIRRGRPDDRLQNKIFVGKYRDCFMIILSQDEDTADRFSALLEDVLIAYGLMGKNTIMGISDVRPAADHFDRAVREAYWSEAVAEIEKETVKFYKDMGIYKLITACIHISGITEYMEQYLSPLFEEEEKDGDLLRTAVEYVLAKGDTIKTAESLFCHKNTVRYRIGKLQEKLDPDSGEKEFYENLAAAVKIYLLLNRQ